MTSEFRRSRMHVLDWVDSPGFLKDLNNMTEGVANVSASDCWMPKGHADPDEATFCKGCDGILIPEMSRLLRDWWLAVPRSANEPNWDFCTTAACNSSREKGLILIEAKAHARELRNEEGGKRLDDKSNMNNHDQIGRAIEESRLALSQLMPGVAISRDSHYQCSNRIAFAWKLASEGIPTALVYLGFTGDTGIPKSDEPLEDASHWKRVAEHHITSVLPREMIGKRIDAKGMAPLWCFIRSLPCLRPTSS
jgi:hypothetical protein